MASRAEAADSKDVIARKCEPLFSMPVLLSNEIVRFSVVSSPLIVVKITFKDPGNGISGIVKDKLKAVDSAAPIDGDVSVGSRVALPENSRRPTETVLRSFKNASW